MASSSSYPFHPASLVHPSEHSPAILDMLDAPIDRLLIEYVVQCTVDVVEFAMRRPSTSEGSSRTWNKYAPFTEFVSNVVYRSEIKVPVLFVALAYINRAKPHLSIALEQWACERVFLGALILAAKYLNDSSLKNVHWALCTGVFGKRDVGRIEREFLYVLDWKLSVCEADILAHHNSILSLHDPTRTHYKTMMIKTKRRRSVPTEAVSFWSDDEDTLSSASSSYSPPTPPSFHDTDLPERSPKRPRWDIPPTTPQRPSRPKADNTLPSALEILKSFPVPLPWSSSASETGLGSIRVHLPVTTAQVWV